MAVTYILNVSPTIGKPMSRCVMRKPAFAYAFCNRAVDQRLWFLYIVQSVYFPNLKFQASSHLLCPCSPVCVRHGRKQKPQREVSSCRGSFGPSNDLNQPGNPSHLRWIFNFGLRKAKVLISFPLSAQWWLWSHSDFQMIRIFEEHKRHNVGGSNITALLCFEIIICTLLSHWNTHHFMSLTHVPYDEI